ncbi:ABC transporter family protein [Clostridium argentinense CDC 2741]|uniref:ABC transporter family protein n=1 Tax=Clostridium argentinense CDC 2741 TaxID=1418104 RepID=A0A0C1QUC7_9CLOT|nr:ABC transporter ATP-binding protein [Clostridium argentinense]ARC83910.1 export ABC transporter ATP-binding protein [Clostridium argentinense]KIE44652.1 ABC transporter family protein [Clostridium argentinense CDC 2741]NFF41249.1 ABC transporter ATP-binding protein [Clostridium argentinense]NFP51635.1 ABC transporter ATP-binding protein [Clostridium argentinense]NFP73962.1 ABC transporter ATP-binding protein [Clostridium argentinense]
MKFIEIKNLTKRFNDKLVIDNVSLGIEKGEIFGLLGPNGAGKSTLINLMVGLLKIDRGEVVIGGYNISKEPLKAKEKIGLVPQEIALFENLNAKENLEYWGGLYGLRGAMLRERINEALEIAALQEHIKKPVKKYSGGMKRRLNIAAAMMHYPEVLIMDEPTVGIDPQSRNHIFEVVKKMNKEYNSTIIYTSHYMEEIEALCDNIFILDLGKEIAYGSKEQLKRMVISDKVIKIKAQGELEKLMFDIKKLSTIRGVEIKEEELKIIANEKITLNELFNEISKHKVEVKNIGIEEPTLEEVFLTLTGKKLRDKEE